MFSKQCLILRLISSTVYIRFWKDFLLSLNSVNFLFHGSYFPYDLIVGWGGGISRARFGSFLLLLLSYRDS